MRIVTAKRASSKSRSRSKSATSANRKQGAATALTTISKGSTIEKEKTMTGTSGNQAKKKLKNLQSKKQTVRLARLEKMYQELTEIDAKR